MSSLILSNNNKPFLNRTVTCNKKWILYDNRYNQLSGWTRKLQSTFQSQPCTKKSHGHYLVVCCPSGRLQLSESQWNHYIWEICPENRWDAPKTATPAAGTGQQKGHNSPWQCPTTHRTTSISKVEWIWLRFCLICNIQWPLEHLPTSHQLPLLWSSQQLFARKTLPWPAGGRECFWRIYRILKHRFLHHRNKSTYFSLAKLCWS